MSDEAISGGTAVLSAQADGAAAIIEVAQEATEPFLLDTGLVYSILVPSGARVEQLDLERYLPAPKRARGTYKLATVQSFIDYVALHALPDHTTVWVHPTEGRVRAVIDDNAEGAPDWRDHRVELTLLPTEEWQLWLSRDGILGPQSEFAQHLEEGVLQIVSPDAADMLELAQSFHASTNASFRSGQRLDSGQVNLQYDEEVQAKAGQKGEIEVPQVFTLALAPFVGEEPVQVEARLRYRVSGGHLAIGYKLTQPQRIIRESLERIADRLKDEFERVYFGEPAA